MRAKNCEKIQHLGHFSGYALGKKLGFCAFWSKNKNKSRRRRNIAELCRHLYKSTYRGSAKFCSILNKPRFILIFRLLMLCQELYSSAADPTQLAQR